MLGVTRCTHTPITAHLRSRPHFQIWNLPVSSSGRGRKIPELLLLLLLLCLATITFFLASCFSSRCLDFLWCRCEFWDKQLLLHSSNSLFWHSVRGQRNRTSGNVGNVEGCLAREFSRRPVLPSSGPGTVLFCFWNFNVFRGIWDKSQRFESTRPVVS